MPFTCPASSEVLLDHLEKAVDVFAATARRAIDAGDVQPKSWHSPVWMMGFEPGHIYASQPSEDSRIDWDKILSSPVAHRALTLRARYEAGICEASDHLMAFRDGLVVHHPALAATFDRLNGFHVRLQGGGENPLTLVVGTTMARGETVMKLCLPRHYRSSQVRSTWKKVLSISARIGTDASLSHYQTGDMPIAAPNAPAAAVLAGALLGLNAKETAQLRIFHEADAATQAAAVRALLRRPTTTT